MVVGNIINKIKERRRSSVGRTRSRSSRSSSSGSNGGMKIDNCGSLNLLMLGDRNVGKTSICSRYVLDNFYNSSSNGLKGEELFESAIFLSPQEKNENVKQYDLHITVSQDRHDGESVQRYKQQILNADGFVLVYSKDDRPSYMKLIELISDVQKIKRKRIPIVILGNKVDLKQSLIHVQENIVLTGFTHFDVSAVDNDGIQEAFRHLVQLCVAEGFLA